MATSNISIITDPVTNQQFSRDTSVAGSTYQPYTAPKDLTGTTLPPGTKAPEGYEYGAGGLLQKIVAPAPAPSTHIGNPIPPPSSETAGLTVPAPTAPTTYEQFTTSLGTQADTARKQLEDSYKAKIDDLEKKAADSQAKIDAITQQQQGNLDQINSLSQPFRADLEKNMEETLYVRKNFEENQKLTDELKDLLTQGNDLITQEKGRAIPTAILTARVNQTMSDISARAGVIQAVINARNGQIAQAYTMIDRTISATTADKQDQINYYKTLLDFEKTQKDEEGKKLVTFTTDEKKYMDAQIGLLEQDNTNIQKNAEAIKEAMLDPDKAMAYAKSGVTLTDSPEQISQKLATWAYHQEKIKLANDMASKGFSYLAPGQKPPDGASVEVTVDSQGNRTSYYKTGLPKVSSTGTSPADTVTNLQAAGIPVNVATSSGELTKGYRDKLLNAGISLDLVDGLWKDIASGYSLEQIREALNSQNIDPKVLDTFVETLQGGSTVSFK